MLLNRSETGDLVTDPVRFPSGIKSLVDQIHSMGMKFGIYESAGYKTCQRFPGSLGVFTHKFTWLTLGYEDQDAMLFTSYGINVDAVLTQVLITWNMITVITEHWIGKYTTIECGMRC